MSANTHNPYTISEEVDYSYTLFDSHGVPIISEGPYDTREEATRRARKSAEYEMGFNGLFGLHSEISENVTISAVQEIVTY